MAKEKVKAQIDRRGVIVFPKRQGALDPDVIAKKILDDAFSEEDDKKK